MNFQSQSKIKLIGYIFAILSLTLLPLSLATEFFSIQWVIDGDTLFLANIGRVRLIGVDTPEVHISGNFIRMLTGPSEILRLSED